MRGDSLHIRLRVVPLPDEVVSLLEKSSDILHSLKRGNVEQAALDDFR